MDARLLSVNLSSAETVHDVAGTQDERTGIDKRPVAGPVPAVGSRLGSDLVCDTEHHGGVDQAVYAYAAEDAHFWSVEVGRELGPGAFGENLTTVGVDVTSAVIGERWAIGTTVLEVSVPRIPCNTFAQWWGVPDLVKRFTHAGRPGAYLRIWTEGELQAGDSIAVVHRPDHRVTVSEAFRALTGDRTLAARLLEAPQLPAESHRRARVWLGLAAAGG